MLTTSFQRYLEELHSQFTSLDSGAVADYIPELGKADPAWFGIAIVTVDGHVYQVGDTQEPFTIQSISKAFTYGIALEDKGPEFVAGKIDVEPSGEAFNSISLEPETGRPRNPMINAGAIVATSLVDGNDRSAKIDRILEKLSGYVGHTLSVDEEVYLSEKNTGHRNRAIAHLLRNYEILDADPEEPLDAYFRQCSILVNARDLAVMGATLANDGVNPITGVRTLESDKVPRVLSVMATCGMYDYSGNWIYNVGMPAKSGVGGGVVAVLPGQLGLAIFSPRLDEKGNSVRGIAVCEAISREFGLHMLRVTRTTAASVIRTSYTGSQVRSKLARDTASTLHLDNNGDRLLVFELTGELMFVSAEIVVTNAMTEMTNREILILDMTRVTAIDQSASILLIELTENLAQQGKQVIITALDRHYHFVKSIRRHFRELPVAPLTHLTDLDHALEYAEDEILKDAGLSSDGHCQVPLEEQPMFDGFSDEEMDLVRSLLVEETFKTGDLVCKEGEAADRLFFLCAGRVSASLTLEGGRRCRLNGSATGWAFGESALFEGRSRMADIVADSDVIVYSLTPEAIDTSSDPLAIQVKTRLLANLSAVLLQRLARASQEIRILTG